LMQYLHTEYVSQHSLGKKVRFCRLSADRFTMRSVWRWIELTTFGLFYMLVQSPIASRNYPHNGSIIDRSIYGTTTIFELGNILNAIQ